MTKKKAHEMLAVFADFVAIKNLSANNAEALAQNMVARDLDFTPANLEMVHKELSEDLARRDKLESITRHVIESWSSSEFKTKMADPEIAARVNEVLSEKGKKKGQEGQ
jgi:hypothetical protein